MIGPVLYTYRLNFIWIRVLCRSCRAKKLPKYNLDQIFTIWGSQFGPLSLYRSGPNIDCAIGDDGSIVLVIGEWVSEWTVRFSMSRYSNDVTVCLTSTMVHWQTFTVNCFKWEMVMCQIPLSLPAEVDANMHKDCNMSANQSRCSKLSRLHRWSVHSYSGMQLLCDHLL